MALIIDGYNLLHASGVLGPGEGAGHFERSRRALLGVLASSIEEAEISRTTVVFDAQDPPPGLPRETSYRGIRVQFAANHADADSLIEELIKRHSAPRSLTVVSSDHRLQRAARRRRAVAVDSGPWFAQLLRQRHRRNRKTESAPAKPDAPLSKEEVQYWLSEFEQADPSGPSPQDDAKQADDAWNPFPPGYGEDLLDKDRGNQE